ncbi:MAG: hypothetical protein GF307_05040 [candidate division Zixibacteria bacterium]|nr:hypothetical protein [candidate division Zixibacteria bacterium]
MVTINYAFREVVSKIVYYGPGLSGKTTNLHYVFRKVPPQTRGEMISLATEADRTLYFDFLPINLGSIQGFATKFQLYTVPGQVFYNATRKLVLRGVDGLVFVADSQLAKMDENLESLNNLKENLVEYGINYDEIPLIIQYNKRDLPNIATIEQLEAALNPAGAPYFEAVASKGEGVFDTLKAICKIVLDRARSEHGVTATEEVPVGQMQSAENQAQGLTPSSLDDSAPALQPPTQTLDDDKDENEDTLTPGSQQTSAPEPEPVKPVQQEPPAQAPPQKTSSTQESAPQEPPAQKDPNVYELSVDEPGEQSPAPAEEAKETPIAGPSEPEKTPETPLESQPEKEKTAETPLAASSENEKSSPSNDVVPPNTPDTAGFRPDVHVLDDSDSDTKQPADDNALDSTTDNKIHQVNIGLDDFQTDTIKSEEMNAAESDQTPAPEEEHTEKSEIDNLETEADASPKKSKPFIPGFDFSEEDDSPPGGGSIGEQNTAFEQPTASSTPKESEVPEGPEQDITNHQLPPEKPAEEAINQKLPPEPPVSAKPEVQNDNQPPASGYSSLADDILQDVEQSADISHDIQSSEADTEADDLIGNTEKSVKKDENIDKAEEPTDESEQEDGYKPKMDGMKKRKKEKKSLFGWFKKLGRSKGGE